MLADQNNVAMDRTAEPTVDRHQILCYYCNQTGQIQVGLVLNGGNYYLEQVLFPGQRWMFWAPGQAQLNVYAPGQQEPLLLRQISCQQLQVVE